MFSMKVLVRYFAVLREEKSCEQEWVPIHHGMSIAKLFDRLFTKSQDGIRFAVNQCYVSPDHILVDGDEVAFLPPLGGG